MNDCDCAYCTGRVGIAKAVVATRRPCERWTPEQGNCFDQYPDPRPDVICGPCAEAAAQPKEGSRD